MVWRSRWVEHRDQDEGVAGARSGNRFVGAPDCSHFPFTMFVYLLRERTGLRKELSISGGNHLPRVDVRRGRFLWCYFLFLVVNGCSRRNTRNLSLIFNFYDYVYSYCATMTIMRRKLWEMKSIVECSGAAGTSTFYVAHYESYHRCIHFSSCDATRAFFCGARVRVARSLRQLKSRGKCTRKCWLEAPRNALGEDSAERAADRADQSQPDLCHADVCKYFARRNTTSQHPRH